MAKARKAKQLSFTVKNRVGLLSEITSALSASGVNIRALCAYEMNKKASFMMIVDSTARAKKALSFVKGSIGIEDVVAVEMPNTVGSLEKVAEKIADAGIDIHYVYATTGIGLFSTCILKTADDGKVIRMINRQWG